MTTTMGPPPPKTPTATATAASLDGADASISGSPIAIPIVPPLSRDSSPSEPEPEPEPAAEAELSGIDHQQPESNPLRDDTSGEPNQLSNPTDISNDVISSDVGKKKEQQNGTAAVPYKIPEWSAPPGHEFVLEVLKDGAIINQFDVNKKGAYMFGRVDLCDFVLEHPTISRFHAVLQFKSNGGAYLYDLGSTHGTFINKSEVKKRVYVDLHVGDVIRFGQSSRLYIFQGPSDLMRPEADLKKLRKAKIQQNMQDMEASLLRAKVEASRADGISWGMGEDAIEENEDEVDEITWQTYKGLLTEKQEKTREKVIKRLEKIAHMKKEIDAIRAKDIAQGGLTQGQQTQIARNEQRISQILEELENLEETLNESIRESLGARTGKLSHGKKKGSMEDEEDEYLSDDDDFYDRTQKSLKNKSRGNQSVETADSLLDKKDALSKQIEDKEKLLLDEDKPAEIKEVSEAGDELDAYMSAVSSQLVLDKKEKIQKELSVLQSELDRILYLLKLADPTGEASRKRESAEQKPNTVVKNHPASDAINPPLPEKNLPKNGPSSDKNPNLGPEGTVVKSVRKETLVESKAMKEQAKSVNDESTATVYTAAKPQWLGAVEDIKRQEIKQENKQEIKEELQEKDQFVDYKDRETILTKAEPGIEDAAPGLIIRKRKQVGKSNISEVKYSEQSIGPDIKAEDAVALLLKHSRGYLALDEEDSPINEDGLVENQGRKKGKKAKKVLGPEKPSFLSEPDAWVPPEGQSGDGRTSLNERFGY
ncbi:hypothetical protein ABFS82_08G035800 [Erythranthe guttata]|uniref:FHA domain-containing protein n=1 Tax=Erythranthe guttata TaxID=4155 RepID=A0A022RWW3_ERYGU|nr:PREDICTED: kanadaptin [Erythranthe guttata]EYU44253.1 hypothetical protein MIMGU_mgv1a001755mg [Erythranthe guttata]|eukprot:XP_012852030.1 PREDICTED: kanadaptin [Erythranthe guttata]